MTRLSCTIRGNGKRLFRYLERVMIAFSVLFNVIFGGRANQTFSARNYEWKKQGKLNIVWLIDSIFFFDPDHCMMSWLYWSTAKNIRKYKNRYVLYKRDMVEYKYNEGESYNEYTKQSKQSDLDGLRRSLT